MLRGETGRLRVNVLWPFVFEAMRDRLTTYSDELQVASQSNMPTSQRLTDRTTRGTSEQRVQTYTRR